MMANCGFNFGWVFVVRGIPNRSVRGCWWSPQSWSGGRTSQSCPPSRLRISCPGLTEGSAPVPQNRQKCHFWEFLGKKTFAENVKPFAGQKAGKKVVGGPAAERQLDLNEGLWSGKAGLFF